MASLDDIPIAATPPSADIATGSEGTPGYSDTNIQEAGVDEADKVKTDGNYLYIAQQDGAGGRRRGACTA